jgi:hypothetical protein
VTLDNLKVMTVDQLVDRFAEIGIAQEKAIDDLTVQLWESQGKNEDTSKVDRLFGDMKAIDDELRKRGRDARLALTRLFNNRNIQVRLSAAKLTLGVAPVEARRVIEQIGASKIYPQAGDAGMTLVNLDEGVFKPD